MRNLTLGLALMAGLLLAVPGVAGPTYQHGELTPKKIIVKEGVVSHGPITASTGTVTASTGTFTDAATVGGQAVVKTNDSRLPTAADKTWLTTQAGVRRTVAAVDNTWLTTQAGTRKTVPSAEATWLSTNSGTERTVSALQRDILNGMRYGSVVWSQGQAEVAVTFDAPAPAADYHPLISITAAGATDLATFPTVKNASKTTTGFTIQVPAGFEPAADVTATYLTLP